MKIIKKIIIAAWDILIFHAIIAAGAALWYIFFGTRL